MPLPWPAIGKFVSPQLLELAIRKAIEANRGWKSDKKATAAVQWIMHQAIIGADGVIPDERQQVAVDNLRFTTTLLTLGELVPGPVYLVEVVNVDFPSTDKHRDRLFAYKSSTNDLRHVNLDRYYRHITKLDHWILETGQWNLTVQDHADPNWFLHPVGRPGWRRDHAHSVSAVDFKTRARNKRAFRRHKTLVHEHVLDSRHQVREDRLACIVDRIAFQVTPLRSFQAERPLLYFITSTNLALPGTHPIRTIANIYNAVANELWWLW